MQTCALVRVIRRLRVDVGMVSGCFAGWKVESKWTFRIGITSKQRHSPSQTVDASEGSAVQMDATGVQRQWQMRVLMPDARVSPHSATVCHGLTMTPLPLPPPLIRPRRGLA